MIIKYIKIAVTIHIFVLINFYIDQVCILYILPSYLLYKEQLIIHQFNSMNVVMNILHIFDNKSHTK